jgi:hypothetical protein
MLEFAGVLFATLNVFKSYTENPAPGSVTSRAFCPLTGVAEKGSNPPVAGVDGSKSAERLPSAATSHAARKPGVGGTPLTDARSFVPS